MPAPFKNLFGLAKELGMTKDQLSDGAAQWTGESSLRSLSPAQIRQYETRLKLQVKGLRRARVAAVESEFERNGFMKPAQRIYMIDLILETFGGMGKFRIWLNRYFEISSERFLTVPQTRKVIVALEDMRRRGFKA